MTKAQIVQELEDMVMARLFSRRRWLADAETCIAVNRKLVQLGLLEIIGDEPTPTRWQTTALGKELNVDLFQVFFGIIYEDDVPTILEHYRLIDESEFDAICDCNDNAECALMGYVKRAYFKYRNAMSVH